MKSFIFRCNPLTHGMSQQHLSTYMQDIGERVGSYPRKAYGGKNYLTIIKQTKSAIIVEVM